MVVTTGQIGPIEGTALERRYTQEPSPWVPPQSLWRLYLLCVLSSGVWLCFWAWDLASDLKRHRDNEIHPKVFSLGALVPGLNTFLILQLANIAEKIDTRAGASQRRNHWLLAVLLGALLAPYPCHLAATTFISTWDLDAALTAVALLLLQPLPIIMVQNRVNILKAQLIAPRWKVAPSRLHPEEAGFIAAILVAGAIFVIRSMEDEIERWQGESLPAKQTISGESGLYILTTPDAGWVRVDRDHFYPDSDLSLYGPSSETSLLVWVTCKGDSVDKRVRFRRGKKRKAYRDLTIEERRELMAKPFIPVSHARYVGVYRQKPVVSLVATITHGQVMVEVIGATAARGAERNSMERFVRSLEVKEGARSCEGR